MVTDLGNVRDVRYTQCCIVGAGPAGSVLALLLARSGIRVVHLEAHMDFEREFRGDTFHPSVMEIMEELAGKLKISESEQIGGWIGPMMEK